MANILTVRLTTSPRLEIVDELQVRSVFPPERFPEPDLDQSNGFYDFLRPDAHTIVGVRWAPFSERVLDNVKQSRLVRVDTNGPTRLLTVWFGRESDFKDEISGDQWFWWNRIFVDHKTKEIAITFGLSGLSDVEVQSIVDRLHH